MEVSTYSYESVEDIFPSLGTDRRRQFIDRLQWDLRVGCDGVEVDDYDVAGTTYIAAHHQGQHFGSCRVRPLSLSNMIADHFSECFSSAQWFLDQYRADLLEITRFCRSPDITRVQCKLMLDGMRVAMETVRRRYSADGFVAVVHPGVARLMRINGIPVICVAEGSLNDGSECLLVFIGPLSACCTTEERSYTYSALAYLNSNKDIVVRSSEIAHRHVPHASASAVLFV